ncbi:MAG: NAD-dependent epimerase/dehydratase family protein [Candidatus Omnitrophota bacterium]
MKGFWKNKRVLITGYEGFLGSHLTKRLIELGAGTFGLDIITHRKETILRQDLGKIRITKGSVEDFRLVSRLMKANKIEYVFHLAAVSLVHKAQASPLSAFSTNIRGTWNILEVCRNLPFVKAVIVASSDKAYGAHKKLPYTEEAPLIANHPYDVSKSCADLIAHSYFYTYGLPVAVTRCGNIFGPGDFNFSRIVPDAIRCAFSGETLLIRSNGRFTRDYIFVDDIVNGYLILAQKLQKLKLGGEAFNFSDEKPLTVLELIRIIYKISRIPANYKILNQAKFEIKHQYLSSLKARRVLGWAPEVSLEQGLKRTIEWYKHNLRARRFL